MSQYNPNSLPFWATDKNSPSYNESKKLVYELPKAMKRDIMVHKDIGSINKMPQLGGFDGNGNRWINREKELL